MITFSLLEHSHKDLRSRAALLVPRKYSSATRVRRQSLAVVLIFRMPRLGQSLKAALTRMGRSMRTAHSQSTAAVLMGLPGPRGLTSRAVTTQLRVKTPNGAAATI